MNTPRLHPLIPLLGFLALFGFAAPARAQTLRWTLPLGAPPSAAQGAREAFIPDGAGGCAFVFLFDDDNAGSPNPTVRRVYWVNKKHKLEVFDFPVASGSAAVLKVTESALYLDVGTATGHIARRIKRTNHGVVTDDTTLGAVEGVVPNRSDLSADALGFFTLEYSGVTAPVTLRRYSN